jgi:hypothetical protein
MWLCVLNAANHSLRKSVIFKDMDVMTVTAFHALMERNHRYHPEKGRFRDPHNVICGWMPLVLKRKTKHAHSISCTTVTEGRISPANVFHTLIKIWISARFMHMLLLDITILVKGKRYVSWSHFDNGYIMNESSDLELTERSAEWQSFFSRTMQHSRHLVKFKACCRPGTERCWNTLLIISD